MKYGALSQGDVEIDGKSFFLVASGITSERPAKPEEGMIRYNTELEAANVGDFSGFGRFESYLDGKWTPLVSMVDFVDPADLFSTENVTLRVLADMIRDFFVQGMGMIEVNQNNIWGFGATSDYDDAISDNLFFDPMAATGATDAPAGTPMYMYSDGSLSNGWKTTNSNPSSTGLQAGGMLRNRLVQQIFPIFKPVVGTGMLYEVNLTSGGSGYTKAPKVVIDTGGGEGAVGVVEVDLDATSGTYGEIIGAGIVEQGDGYRSGGYVKAYLKGGGGEGAVLQPDVVGGKVVGLTILNPGKNYTSHPAVSFADGGARGFISAEVSNGSVTNLTILSRGLDYVDIPGYQPTIKFVSDEAGVTPATAEVTLGTGKIIDVEVMRGGSGYASPPAVIVNGNCAKRALVQIQSNQVEDGTITGIDIIDSGSQYDPADPTLSVTIVPSDTTTNSVQIASTNAVDFVFDFNFDIFKACGVPGSQKSNYKLGLFTSVYKVLPHYGHDGYGQQFYQSVSLIPKWDATLSLEDQTQQADYGKYTGNMTLQGQRAYYMQSIGALFFANLTKFQGF